MAIYVFQRPVTMVDVFKVEAANEAEARRMVDDDPYAFLEGECQDARYGAFELDAVELESAVEMLNLLAAHAAVGLREKADHLPAEVGSRLRAQLAWLQAALVAHEAAIDELTVRTPYPSDLTVSWEDRFGHSWTFSPASALWDLMAYASDAGFPAILASSARDWIVTNGHKMAGLP